jgi:hypothetical protein
MEKKYKMERKEYGIIVMGLMSHLLSFYFLNYVFARREIVLALPLNIL